MVDVTNSGSCKNEQVMCLVRCLFFICASHNIECRSVHISTHKNVIADSLSRLDMERFRSNAPRAQPHPVAPSSIDWWNY